MIPCEQIIRKVMEGIIMKMLDGLLVLDFSQYLSGPWATMRLGDLGARVIKIESPRGGDGSRRLTLKNIVIDGDSSVFHSMNRNKESYCADLKEEKDLVCVKKLIEQADVMVSNFRPGVMAKFGLDYENVKDINPKIVYASITGFGSDSPWKNKPGQDLLLQSVTGIPFLNGNKDQPPVPVGLAVVDMFTGANSVQAILAAIIQRHRTGVGAHVEMSMIEAALDYQFEVVTTFLNDNEELPERSGINNAHPLLAAPYGIYETKDSFIALAMGSVVQLGDLLNCEKLLSFRDSESWYNSRDEIKGYLVDHLKTGTTKDWLDRLEPAGYWCSPVYNMKEIMNHDLMETVDMVQEVNRPNGMKLKTTRCPIRVNGDKLFNTLAAPSLGANTESIKDEFDL